MSRSRQVFTVLAATSLAVPLWGSPASAATSSEPAATGAYFYSAGVDKPADSPAAPPNITGDRTDMVASEHLAVAVRVPNEIDKKSFLSFDLSSVPFDATITKAIVSVPLAEDGDGNTSMSPAAAKVRACMAGDEGFNGEDGASFAVAPAEKCDVFAAPGKDSADKKSYTFDISKMAASWLTEANNGMALTVAEGATSSPFQVVFQPFAKASIALEFTAPVEEVVTEVVTPTAPDAAAVDTGFSGDAGSFDSGSVATAPVPDAGGFGTAEAPVVDPGAAVVEPAPEAAAPAVAAPAGPVALVPVAAVSVPMAPSTSFWLLGLLLAAGLALLSLIMGDPRQPVADARGATRLAKTLEQREAAARPARGLSAARPLSL